MPDASEELLGVLASLDNSIQFVTSGSLTPVLPGLDVKGLGELRFPIDSEQAQGLVQLGSPAPFGRGEETVYDETVRSVCQLEPKQFSFRNPEWKPYISRLVETVNEAFGLDRPLTPKLYKMLVYKEGDFFLPHRDSEKQNGMIATLIVCLPSRHEGGALMVSHDGLTQEIGFGGDQSEFKLQYAAFYADVEHEIKPVTSGHRVCLVYNLLVTGKRRSHRAPLVSGKVNRAAQLLETLFTDHSRDKFVLPLSHDYSEAGLGDGLLKGWDIPAVTLLSRAADQLGYCCYIALMTHHQEGSVDEYSLYYDDYEGYSLGDDSEVEMLDIYDESITLDCWIDADGNGKDFGVMELGEDEIPTAINYEDFAVEQELQGPTGNEGTTMDRWYRSAVVVLWPQSHHYSLLAGNGQRSALPELATMIAAKVDAAGQGECLAFANAIVDGWHLPGPYSYDSENRLSAEMASLLEELGDGDTADRFIRQVLAKDCLGTEGEALAGLCSKIGWERLTPALVFFVSQQGPENETADFKAAVSIFTALCMADLPMDAARCAAGLAMADPLMSQLKAFDRLKRKISRRGVGTRTGLLENLVHSMCNLEAFHWAEEVISHALNLPKLYPLHKVLIPAARKLHSGLEEGSRKKIGYQRLLDCCLKALVSLTETPIPAPTDWAQNPPFKCRCKDCGALLAFLKDPVSSVGRFKMGKERRKHLHRQIDRFMCDVSHVTERRGKPFTLVCTKNRNSYEKRVRQFEKDTKLLAELRLLAAN